MIDLEHSAYAVITDSGGMQEETTALRIPCFAPSPFTHGTTGSCATCHRSPRCGRELGRAESTEIAYLRCFGACRSGLTIRETDNGATLMRKLRTRATVRPSLSTSDDARLFQGA